jgi:hypothetical protein
VRWLPLFLFLASSVLSAQSIRLEREGRRVSGGEICLFEAGDPDNPVKRLLSFQTVRCSSADRPLELPPGLWNVFARHDNGMVSEMLLLARDGKLEGSATLEMVKANELTFSLSDLGTGQIAVYVEATGTVIPLAPEKSTLLAPAGVRLFPLFIKDGRLRAIDDPLILTPAQKHAVRFDALERLPTAVGLRADRAAFEAIGTKKRRPGRVEFIAKNRKPVPALNDLSVAFRGRDAIAFFADAPLEGEPIARLGGEGWAAAETKLAPDAILPLRVAPTSLLRIDWSLPPDTARLQERVANMPACPRLDEQRREEKPTSLLRLTLDRCPTGARDQHRCESFLNRDLDPSVESGTEVFSGVPAGTYRLRLGYGDLPPADSRLSLESAEETRAIALEFNVYFGKVTRDGKALHARFAIEGAATTSDPESGEYLVVAAKRENAEPRRHVLMIQLTECREGKEYLITPDEFPVPNSRYDLEIRPSTVEVETVDAVSGSPVPAAEVSFCILHPNEKHSCHIAGPIGKSDDKGRFTIEDLPANRNLIICGEHERYIQECVEPFTLDRDGKKSVRVALKPADIYEGVVIPPLVDGILVFYRPDGTTSEYLRPDAAGKVMCKKPHPAGEIVAVISRNMPLYVYRQTEPLAKNFEIRFPAAPVRDVDVRVSAVLPDGEGFVGLSIGDLLVPGNVFSWHQQRRGRDVTTLDGTVEARGILATGPLTFYLAPFKVLEALVTPAERERDVDFFYVAAAASFPRKEAGAASEVVIGE